MEYIQMTDSNKEKSKKPTSLRLESDLHELWDEVAQRLPQESRHALAVAALRYGLEAIKKDPKILYEMEQAALKAKWKVDQ